MTIRFLVFPFLLLLFSCASKSQVDYVQLSIPDELKGNSEAVAYLEKDAKNVNKTLNHIDDILTDMEELMVYISTQDLKENEEPDPAVVKEVMSRIEGLSSSYVKFHLTLLWTFGKDLFSEDETAKKLITKMETPEGIVFKKSLDHIKLKKELIKSRMDLFVEKMERSTALIEAKTGKQFSED